MRVMMLGTGYVGLVSGACLADFGHEVVCVDNDVNKIESLDRAVIPIFEPGLDDLISTNVKAGRLSFTTAAVQAAKGVQVIFIAVGTPARHGDGYADLGYIHQAARDIAPLIEDFTVVVIKSTVPVGTCDEVEHLIRQAAPNADFAVVSNPEFLREGAAIEDFKRPDRVVIGVQDHRAQEIMAELYAPLGVDETPMLFTDRRTSELIKYAANGFLALKITFINEMSDLCEKVGADVQDVARGLGLDNRIGSKFLHPGPGYGGSCFPKDTLAVVKTARDAGSPVRLIETVIDINEKRKRRMVDKIVAACGGEVRNKRLAILGLTFKPNTDDMRDAPSLVIVPALQQAGAQIVGYDPQGMAHAAKMLSGVQFAMSAYSAIEDADALVVLTEWDAFRALDLRRVKALLKAPIVIDLRNIYRPSEMSKLGFHYESLGRASAPSPIIPSETEPSVERKLEPLRGNG